MADFTLSEGDNIVIRTATAVDNFVYEGGKITVGTAIPFVLTGQFIFKPTSTIDPGSQVMGAFAARLSIEAGSNGLLHQFKVYDMYPNKEALFFPCAIIDQDIPSEVRTNFFGGEFMQPLSLITDVAFRSDYQMWINETDSDGKLIVLKEESLAQHLLDAVSNIYRSISFESDYVKVGDLVIDASVMTPQTPKQSLYGFRMDIFIDYKEE